MARSYMDDLAKQLRDSVAGNRDSLREVTKVVNFAGELDRAMKKAMGLDLGIKKAMGLDLDLRKAMGPSVAETVSSAGRLGEQLAAEARRTMAGMPNEELMRLQKEFAAGDARLSVQAKFDSAYLSAIGALVPPLSRLAYGEFAGIRGITDTLTGLNFDKAMGFSPWARSSFEALTRDLYAPEFVGFRPLGQTPSDWIKEELELLLLNSPEYTGSKLAWILGLFAPRLRLALYRQDQMGDFDGVMEAFWEELLQDPEVRARLRERLEKSGIREELHRFLSSHLEKAGEGEWVYAILGLYAHIEAFLAELAVQHGLIPSPEIILCPKTGTEKDRRGVSQLIEALHRGGKISASQNLFLNYVLSNHYQANKVRHGMSLEFSQARATALVLALILALCVAWGVEPVELLQPEIYT